MGECVKMSMKFGSKCTQQHGVFFDKNAHVISKIGNKCIPSI